MAAQFFFADPSNNRDMGEVLSSGYKAGLEMRAGQIKKDLDATYNKHVVTEPQYDAAGNVIARPGDLDHAGFIKTAQAAGLPMQESMQYLAHQKAQRDAMLDQAQTDSNIRDLGYDPSPAVTGRAGAQIGDPNDPKANYNTFIDQQAQARDFANGGVAGAGNSSDAYGDVTSKTEPAPETPKAPETPITADDVWKHIVANKSDKGFIKQFQNEVGTKADGIAGKDTRKALDAWFKAQQAVPDVTNDPNTTVYITPDAQYGSNQTFRLPAPEDATGQYFTPTKSPDNRTAGQAVQDTYNPQAVTVDGGIEDAELNGLFDWAPVDDNSNEFRKYKSTLDSHLKSAGMVDAKGNPDASMLLKQLYVNTYNQNLAAKPDTRLRALGPEGRKKYIEMDAEYKASQIKAAGLAGKAVLDQRQKLSEEANKYGVQTNDSTEEKRKNEKHEADLAGRRPDDYKFRWVTEAEAAKGRDITSAYFDIRDGVREGGFAGAYKAAVAKAKSDGSVNRDAIIANLIAMKAAASSDAIKLNFYMSSDGNLTAAGLKFITSKEAGKGPSKEWGKSALSNLAETARLYGFDPEKKVPPPAKKGPGSKRAPKKWTSKPDGTEQVGDTYKGHTLGADGKWR